MYTKHYTAHFQKIKVLPKTPYFFLSLGSVLLLFSVSKIRFGDFITEAMRFYCYTEATKKIRTTGKTNLIIKEDIP